MILVLAICMLAVGVSPPGMVKAVDAPNDDGQSVIVTWELSPDDELLVGYDIVRWDPNLPERAATSTSP